MYVYAAWMYACMQVEASGGVKLGGLNPSAILLTPNPCSAVKPTQLPTLPYLTQAFFPLRQNFFRTKHSGH